MFICLVGARSDGHEYIKEAVARGAAAVFLEKEEYAEGINEAVVVAKVKSGRRALALMSAAYFGYPAQKLTTIGITGTKGKTTTAHIVRKILETDGRKTGMIGTVGVFIGDNESPSENTTPESYELHKIMAQMVKAGCEYMVMEVSSQATKLDRTAGINFDYGVFLNLSQDHIGPGEHEDFAEYLECKSLLFRQCRVGIINADDPYAADIAAKATCRIVTISTEKEADFRVVNSEIYKASGKLGMKFKLIGLNDCKEYNSASESCELMINIPGDFSVYNAVVAVAVCSELKVPVCSIRTGLENIYVKGRVEPLFVSDDFHVIVDFAHNGVSVESVLKTLRKYSSGRLVCIFGCGGNRSRDRRYDMGEAAGGLADFCILTEDNPRSETVAAINADIIVGLNRTNGKYIEIENRKEAIEYAITHAIPGDIIVLLGKGHETYIEKNGIKTYYSEHETVDEIMKKIKGVSTGDTA